MKHEIMKNPIAAIILAAVLAGGLIALVKPLSFLISGERCPAVILNAEYRDRTPGASNREVELFYSGVYTSPAGETIPFEYIQGNRNFGAAKAEGEEFEILWRSRNPKNIMEADLFAMFRLPLFLFGFALLAAVMFGKKKS